MAGTNVKEKARRERRRKDIFVGGFFFSFLVGAYPPIVLRSVAPSPIGMHHQLHTAIWRQPKNTPIGEEETRTKRSPQTKTIEQNQSLDPKQQKNKKNKKETRALSSSFLLFFFGIIISHKEFKKELVMCSGKVLGCTAS